jgi:hypothetical protein
VVTGVQLPLTLLSGILLPLSLGPSWLRVLGHLNPMYYAVQASRSLAAGSVVTGSVGIGFLVTGAVAALALWWGTRSYQRAMALSLALVRDTLAPVFAALGRSTVWLGAAGAGTSAKLVLNNLLVDLVEVTAEALTFAKGLDLDPAAVVELLGRTPLGSPYTVQKARAMLAGDFRPAFALKHAVKDAGLAVDAARASDTRLALTEALLPSWRSAESDGHADDDLSVVYAAGRS